MNLGIEVEEQANHGLFVTGNFFKTFIFGGGVPGVWSSAPELRRIPGK